MTIRIIKRGMAYEKQIFVGECEACRAVFECDRTDGRYAHEERWWVDRYVVTNRNLTLSCPHCGTEVKAVPKDIMEPPHTHGAIR